MALPDPLSIKNAAAVAQSYTRRAPVANGNRYMTTGSTPALSDTIDVRSLLTPSRGVVGSSSFKEGYTRNIATIARTRTDADGYAHTGSMSLSFVRPIGVDITDSDVADLTAALIDFFTASSGDYLTRFKRGET